MMNYIDLYVYVYFFFQVLPKLQNLEVINFGDCLVKTDGAKILATALKDGHKKLKVSTPPFAKEKFAL